MHPIPTKITDTITACCALALAASAPLAAYEQLAPPPNVVLPAGRSPAESLASIKVAADLQVELVAAEPMVRDPIDVSWGPDGRMWVVEMADYPLGLEGRGKPGGRVRFLESTKGDGHYDKSTLFADGLNYPNSVVPWRKGVLVAATPDVLYMEDTDGDGKADRVEKILSGLGEGNQQHRANGLQWGMDGWLYVANGDSGGKITLAKSGQLLDLSQRDFRLKPDEGVAELQSGRTQYGRNRDDWGNWFGCNNSNPIWHYALEDHYLRRNPHLAPPNSTVTVSKTPGASQVFPRSETIARFNDPFGANRFTCACGTMIYRDDLLGAAYAGNVFICEPVHNLVHREIIQPAGVTFTSQRAPEEQKSEFFASTDNWSRFTALRAGPDGALYIVDMYRLVIEHPQWIPDAWQKLLGDRLRAGEDKGRIYRVRPKDGKLRPIPRLDRADAAGLVAALESPSGTVRDLAQQQLLWRQEKSAADGLGKLLTDSTRPQTRVQALCSLDTIGALQPAHVARALKDAHPGVRRQAVRLSESFAGSAPELLPIIVGLGGDPDASVRQQVAYSLGEWKQPEAGMALARLVRENHQEPFILAAAMSSALPHADTMLAQMSAGGGGDRTMIEIAIATQNTRALVRLLDGISGSPGASDPSGQFGSMARLLDGLRRAGKSLAQLQSGADAGLKSAVNRAAGIFDRARATAIDPAAALAIRAAALPLLGRGLGRQDEDLKTLLALLAPQTPVDLQLAAVAAIGLLNLAPIPDRLLAGWDGYGPKIRAGVLDLLVSRPPWANALLNRIESDRALLAQIDTAHRAALLHHSNSGVSVRAARVLDSGIDRNRQKIIDEYLAAMGPLKGDPARGAAVYGNVCTACHKLGNVTGLAIGPDLATLNDRSASYLVTHTLDPNRAVVDIYMLYTAVTTDGRTLTGILAGEAGNSITFKGLDGVEQVILRSEVKTLTTMGRSLMPDGLEAAIDKQAMADLVAFISSGTGATKP